MDRLFKALLGLFMMFCGLFLLATVVGAPLGLFVIAMGGYLLFSADDGK